jgi:hypothetical protein
MDAMQALTLDDLLPLNEYAGRRREFFASLGRYLDRYRRVRIGPRLTLLFENRQTLWFRVQELMRIARLSDPVRVQEELDLYNRLLPRRDQLQAALVVELDGEGRLTEELAPWQDLHGEELTLRIGSRQIPAALVTCRPEDRALGTAHWVQFTVAGEDRRLLENFRLPARFGITRPHYRHESLPLSEEVRRSLLEDLQLSDRDEGPRTDAQPVAIP